MIFLNEGKTLSDLEWMSILKIDKEEFYQLLQRGIFKTVQLSNGAIQLRLVFVGEIALNSCYIISFPKCLDSKTRNVNTARLIKATLKSYFNNKHNQTGVTSEEVEQLFFSDDLDSKEIEVYLSIRSYFEQYGLYKRSEIFTVKDPNKTIYWNKTISNGESYVVDDSIFYPSPFTKKVIKTENLITEIFKAVLSYLSEKYETSDIKNHISAVCETHISFDMLFKNASHYCQEIRSESTLTYSSEELLVLNLVSDFLEDKIRYKGINSLKIYGTNSFHIIWEFLCSYIFNNEYNEYNELISNFYQPKWNINNKIISKGQLIPDVIFKSDDTLFIVDAKYYYPIPQKVCGVSDISKQLIYAQVSSSTNTLNVFAFPADKEESIKNLGYVSIYDEKHMELDDFKSQRIIVIQISLMLAMKVFLGLKNKSNLLDKLIPLITNNEN